MGSLFSRADQNAEAVGHVRTRNETRDENDRPKKRRKAENARKRQERTVAPPTRAMLNRDLKVEKKDLKREGSALTDEATVPRHQVQAKRYGKQKVAFFLGYVGERYFGMQINPGVITIEEVLLRGLHAAGFISDQNKGSTSKVHWMRAARTDKGVSAAGQCVSVKLELEKDMISSPDLAAMLNQHLPDDIEAYGMLKTTGGFNARSDCHRRRYEYMFPVRLLGGPNGALAEENPGAGDPRSAKLSSILKRYEGTHCFANFTDGLTGSDDAARRYMIRVGCGQPFLPPKSGIYFVTIEVYGQSFLLHQIRKMVGLAIFVYFDIVPVEAIAVALCPEVKMPTPMAPALGLLLDSLFFDNYNLRFKDRLQQPVTCDAFSKAKEKFKSERIYVKIAEIERMERTLEEWFRARNQRQHHYDHETIIEQYAKYITSSMGKQEKRKAYVASLYPIKTNMEDFLNSSNQEMMNMAMSIREQFQEEYGTPPTFLARAPGRVILIGEHLDYNGLPVIGTALTQGTMIAGCLENIETIEVRHMEKHSYAAATLRSDGSRMASHDVTGLDSNWSQYVSWGVKAIYNNLPNKKTVSGGGRLLIGGNLPRAGGLASGSSLLTASGLAIARLNRQRIPKLDLALKAAEGERLGAGTRGGAVDHILSMCCKKGSSLQISFTPRTKVGELQLPVGASFFAVGSKVKAEKGFDQSVKRKFNLRAAECRVGAAILARRLDVYMEKSVTTPGQLLFQAGKTGKLKCKNMETLKRLAHTVMADDEVLSMEEIRRQLQLKENEIQNRFLVGANAVSFHIGKRMAHVFSETLRVEEFVGVLQNDKMCDSAKIEALGRIMNDGQDSLRMQFDSSLAEVDELITFCRESGALGSRMTGAGWGGYIVNIVPDDRKEKFLRNLQQRMGKERVIDIEPSAGASIYAIHSNYGAPDRETGGRGKEKKESNRTRGKKK